MNHLINNGYQILRYPITKKQKTIIVSGTGRSGTTALISALALNGLQIKKEHLSSRTLDDWGIGTFLDESDVNSLRREIVKRNLNEDVWGFKWHMFPHWETHLNLFRNPILVVMSRDPFAIASRSNIKDTPEEYGKWLKDISLWQMQVAYSAINQVTIPTIMVSYEKLLSKTEEVLTTICSFCDLPCSKESIDSIIANAPNYTAAESIGGKWLNDSN